MAHILLIEDEQQVRDLLREILEQNGHKIVGCQNGTDGIRLYKESSFDLVIMDVLLPDKDGFETLNALKQHDDNVNVLAISGGFAPGTVNVLHIAQRLGAKETLAKPFDLSDFLTMVDKLLSSPPATA
jgi:DNA-binding NtrC family response regulator